MGEATTIVAIAGGVLSTGITGLVTWKVSKSSASVELAKVEAENQRLQQNNREEERRNRQSTYHQHLIALHEIYVLLGFAAPAKRINKARSNYRNLHAGVVLFAPPSVRKAAYDIGPVYNEIDPAVEKHQQENPGKSDSECWRDATASIKARFGEKIVKLTEQMHADVTRGISEDPQREE